MMKKFFILLLTIIFAFGSIPALSEDALSTAFEVTLYLNPDAIELDMIYAALLNELGMNGEAVAKAMAEQERCMAALINQFSIHGITNDQNVNMQLNLKDKTLATLNGGENGEGVLLLESNMLPNYAFSFPEEYLAENEADNAALTAALQEMAAPVLQMLADMGESMASHIVAAEEGSFSQAGKSYDRYMKIETTGDEMWKMYGEMQQHLIPLLEKLLVAMGMEEDAQAMEESMKDALQAPLPDTLKDTVITIDIYTSTENPLQMYRQAILKNPDCTGYGTFMTDGNEASIRMLVGAATYSDAAALEKAFEQKAEDVMHIGALIQADLGTERRQVKLQAEVEVAANYQRHELDYVSEKTTGNLTYRNYMQPEGPCYLEIALNAWYTDQQPAPMDAGEKTVISYTDFLAATESMEEGDMQESLRLFTAIRDDVSKAMNGLAIQIVLTAPEEIQAIMDAETALSNAFFDDTPYGDDILELEGEDDNLSF